MGMSIDPGAAAQGDEGTSQGAEIAPGPNPAWNDVLEVLPEQFHSMVTPHFQKWDQAAQAKIEQANAKVAEFEPYKEFVEHGIEPGELEQGLRLIYEINQNPQAVYEALGNAYGLSPAEVKQAIDESGDDDDDDNDSGDRSQNYQDPRFDQLQQGIELVGQIVLNEQQQKAADAADAELDTELKGLTEKFGEFNERYVLTMMQNGMSGEEAVQAYQNDIGAVQKPSAPRILGNSSGGSGLPSQAIDPTKWSPKETRNAVAQMLAAAAQENR